MEQGSQLARDMAHIDLELEAAHRALHSYAIIARHDFINARMQHSGEHILRLIDEGRHEEAQALLNSKNWGILEGQEKDEKMIPQGDKEGIEEEKAGVKKDDTQTGA